MLDFICMAPLSCREREGSEKFNMKIYVSSGIRSHAWHSMTANPLYWYKDYEFSFDIEWFVLLFTNRILSTCIYNGMLHCYKTYLILSSRSVLLRREIMGCNGLIQASTYLTRDKTYIVQSGSVTRQAIDKEIAEEKVHCCVIYADCTNTMYKLILFKLPFCFECCSLCLYTDCIYVYIFLRKIGQFSSITDHNGTKQSIRSVILLCFITNLHWLFKGAWYFD